MVKVNFITTLIILQGFFFLYAERATANGVSPTTTQTTTSSSSVDVNNKPGPQVTLTLNVTINCTGGNLSALSISLQVDIKEAYVKVGFKIKSITTRSISCNLALNIVLDLSFFSGNATGKTIKGVFDDAVKNGSIDSLKTDNTVATFTFNGTTITYKPKAGQCHDVCCHGAGGEMTVVPECTPADKCEGIVLPEEKKEDGHCPGDSKHTCTEKCEDDSGGSGDSGGTKSPSFAVVVLLTITSFTKTTFY